VKPEILKEEMQACSIPVALSFEKIHVTDACGFISKYLKFNYKGASDGETNALVS
jgi:hypothetical protein